MNEVKTSEGLTLPEINTDKQDSGHAPYFHFECPRLMPPDDSRREMRVGYKPDRVPVRKQRHGQVLAEWLNKKTHTLARMVKRSALHYATVKPISTVTKSAAVAALVGYCSNKSCQNPK